MEGVFLRIDLFGSLRSELAGGTLTVSECGCSISLLVHEILRRVLGVPHGVDAKWALRGEELGDGPSALATDLAGDEDDCGGTFSLSAPVSNPIIKNNKKKTRSNPAQLRPVMIAAIGSKNRHALVTRLSKPGDHKRPLLSLSHSRSLVARHEYRRRRCPEHRPSPGLVQVSQGPWHYAWP